MNSKQFTIIRQGGLYILQVDGHPVERCATRDQAWAIAMRLTGGRS